MNKLPSDFCIHPWSSVFQKSEYETIARNCMVILKRRGNLWARLSDEEYITERDSDGAKHGEAERELSILHSVLDYTTSAEQAAKFSPMWAEAAAVE